MIRNGERVEHFETVRQRKNGSLVAISITVSPICNQVGEIIGLSGIARDISEMKWAEDARQRRQAAQQRLRDLSARDREILALIVAGEPNKVIARKLDRSEKTVEKYRAELMKKLDCHSIAELVRSALSAEL
jgi:FixJ family two-component response regulator